MPKESSNIKERSRTYITSPKEFNVIFHNDDFTTMEFVIFLLINIFHKDDTEAQILMLKVHHEGRAIVGRYSYDVAMSKTLQATNLARENGFPLRITVTPTV